MLKFLDRGFELLFQILRTAYVYIDGVWGLHNFPKVVVTCLRRPSEVGESRSKTLRTSIRPVLGKCVGTGRRVVHFLQRAHKGTMTVNLDCVP